MLTVLYFDKHSEVLIYLACHREHSELLPYASSYYHFPSWLSRTYPSVSHNLSTVTWVAMTRYLCATCTKKSNILGITNTCTPHRVRTELRRGDGNGTLRKVHIQSWTSKVRDHALCAYKKSSHFSARCMRRICGPRGTINQTKLTCFQIIKVNTL